MADENPALFNLGPQAINAALIAKLNTTPLFQNQFAIAVSLNLYRACSPSKASRSATIRSPNAEPDESAGRGVIRRFHHATGTRSYRRAGPRLPAGTVYTCRRGDNSGTNVSADVYFLHNRCAATGTPMVQATTSVQPIAAHCRRAKRRKTTAAIGAACNIDDVTFPGAAERRVLSLPGCPQPQRHVRIWHLGATSKFDDPNGATGAATEPGTNHWRYIAIDGNKPTVEGMANGNYDYAFDNVENLWTGLSGNPLAAGQFLGTLFQSPLALTDILGCSAECADAGPCGRCQLRDRRIAGWLRRSRPNTVPATIAAVQGESDQ